MEKQIDAPTQLILVQPTPFCNIDCRYCYLPDRLATRKISAETLSAIFKSVFVKGRLTNPITFVWHCGEPTVLPSAFYDRAFALQAHYNAGIYDVKNAFQTNGTLLTPEWCEFFRRHDVKIGVSLDGPMDIHDSSRVDRAGKGTYERTMRGIDLLRSHGIDFHVLMVLTRRALERPDDVWRFFRDHKIDRVSFNIEEIEGANRQSSLTDLNAIELYAHFFRELLRLRDEHGVPSFIRDTDFFLGFIRHGQGEIRSSENTPLSILSFDSEGNISTFSPELLGMKDSRHGDFILGNINQIGLADILRSDKLLQLKDEVERGVARCRRECDYFGLCGGGAPSNKLYENGSFDSTETMCCRLRIKTLADVVVGYLEDRVGFHGMKA